MSAIHPHDRDTIAYLRACGITQPLLERVENLAVEASAGRAARTESNHPAHLLGVAQTAIRNALLRTDLDQIKADLTAALDRITPSEVPA